MLVLSVLIPGSVFAVAFWCQVSFYTLAVVGMTWSRQAVYVGPRTKAMQFTGCLLGAHITRGAKRAGQRLSGARMRWRKRPLLRGPEFPRSLCRPEGLRQAPVDDERLAMFPNITLPGFISRWSTPRLWA